MCPWAVLLEDRQDEATMGKWKVLRSLRLLWRWQEGVPKVTITSLW